MLNPPLSLLSDDLIACIVEHIAKLPFQRENLYNLSLADRAFTQFCQTYIFRTFQLGQSSGTKSRISKKLEKTRKILNSKPSFANRVRVVELAISHKRNAWLFNDHTLIGILQLFAKSPIPPHELHFGGHAFCPFTIEDPILVVGRLMQSFFSDTLTILHLTQCQNVPLPLFLICPRLREVLLAKVGVAEESYENYPDKQCSGRESPALELFDYRDSQSLVKQMITPPLRFHTPVVLWSKLRILTLSPHEKEEMACLQPILDVACNTLEELYLTNLRVDDDEQLSLAGLVNLSDLSHLHVFALHATIKCDVPGSAVLRDINIVLGTIPASNKVTNLSFDFTIFGEHPFGGCLDEDWVGICDEVIRISSGKPLELDFKMTVSTAKLQWQHPGEEELYVHITERTASLSDYPKICTHFWNPTCWTQGLGPFPRGQASLRLRLRRKRVCNYCTTESHLADCGELDSNTS
ncbi:hypothetical protein BDZ97DRAFT_2078106 [Flammula alnicola]|nr:hypothetical protein BDZ97DRAFT_2078106 [Flammula alnicola]